MSEECRRLGWPGEVALLPDRIHVLVEVPGHVSREELIRNLRRVSTEVVQGLAGNAMPRQVWEDSCWCSVITNGPAVDAVRRRIRSINMPAASVPP